MKFKVGDKVRVKTWDELLKIGKLEDAEDFGRESIWPPEGGRCMFADKMEKHCGALMTIEEVGHDDYFLKEDGIGFAWEDWMLEAVRENEEPTPEESHWSVFEAGKRFREGVRRGIELNGAKQSDRAEEVRATIDAVTYIKARRRMCKKENCSTCLLYIESDDHSPGFCKKFERENPEKAVALIEQWAKEHPVKTRKDVLLEKFPDAPLETDGSPVVCAEYVGIVVECEVQDCRKCWNTEVE